MKKTLNSVFNGQKNAENLKKAYFVDQKIATFIFKELEKDLEKSQKKLAKYYKETKSLKLNESERVGLIWFAENYHYLEDVDSNLEETLDPKGASFLPILQKDEPRIRIIELAYDFIGSRKKLSSSTLSAYIKAFQRDGSLTLAELWFFPTAFQMVATLEIEKRLSGVFLEDQPSVEKFDRDIKYLILLIIAINKINWKKLVESVSLVEAVLSKDPAKIYKKMDFKTRDAYRHIVEDISKRTGISEVDVASHSLEMAKKTKGHIGYFIAGPEKEKTEAHFSYRPRFKERIRRSVVKARGMHLVLVLLSFTFFVTVVILSALNYDIFSILTLPLFILILVGLETFFNRLLIRVFPPQSIYKLDYDEGIVKNQRTLVVVPTLLTKNTKDPESLLENLELNYLSNKDQNIFYSLLLSFPEVKGKKDIASDEELRNLDHLIEGLKKLNSKYSKKEDLFLLFFRKRKWSECQGSCVEWERKRGKIIELTRLLRGGSKAGFHIVTANEDFLRTIKYVITLDRGELLTKDAAKKLIAAIGHPLNKPAIDPKRKIVTHGYGIIQPTMISIKNNSDSFFTRMLGSQGWDSYSGLASNVYQDIFTEGTYFGKGIFDVDIFNEVIDGRFAEDRVLSHDLIEGFYCRTGYASDIQVFEEEPHAYLSFAQRKERWIRGDWQNFFWLLGRIKNENKLISEKNPLFLHHRWRILGNLLRSLVFPFSFLALLYNWFFIDSESQFLITVIILAVLNAQLLVDLVNILPSSKMIKAWKYYLRTLANSFFRLTLGFVFKLVFSFHLGLLSLEAIFKALYRVIISRKKTLEWQAFHQTKGNSNSSLSSIFRFTLKSQILALTILVIYLFYQDPEIFPTMMLFTWSLTPFFVYIFSYNFSRKESGPLKVEEKRLRLIALKTWRFFEETVSEKSNQLPPDHFLDIGSGKTSPMTSITNIGMYLLSVKAANDLGHIGEKEFLEKLALTLNIVKELETHRGHFYNWYDVSTKKSLSPRYISTVDSGNFAACLLTLKSAAMEIGSTKIESDSTKEALDDYLVMLLRAHDESGLGKRDEKSLALLLEDLRKQNSSLRVDLGKEAILSLSRFQSELRSVAASYKSYKSTKEKKTLDYWFLKADSLLAKKIEHLNSLFPWEQEMGLEGEIRDWLDELSLESTMGGLEKSIRAKLDSLNEEKASNAEQKLAKELLLKSEGYISKLREMAESSVQTINSLVFKMDFAFLFDRDQELFRIGYNVDKNRFDKSCYDLLASEARLASFIALSKNDIPLDHWPKLGRPLAHHKGELVLLSWGGSMFEYFFSQMFLPTRPGSLIDMAEKSAVRLQQEYAKENDILWGTSESSYVQRNRRKDYLYKMHGVPALGMRRLFKKDLVVAPYATFLVLEKDTFEALENIKKLQLAGFENKYGFYEAIDYTREKSGETAKVYMAHHQGAIIISIVNLLKNRPFENRFMKNVEARAINYLLEEKIIARGRLRDVFDIKKISAPKFIQKGREKNKEDDYLSAPLYHVISNGRLKSYLSHRGGSSLEYENTEIVPLSMDPTLDDLGFSVYLKDNRAGTIWSTGYRPTIVSPDEYSIRLGENYFKQERLNFGIQTELESFIHPEINAEIKALTVTNKSQKRRSLSIVSFGEVSLFSRDAWRAHPNFQKLKVLVYGSEKNGITFMRTGRKDENVSLFSHFLITEDANEKIDLLSERAAFIGNGTIREPMAVLYDRFPRPISGFDKIFAAKKSLVLLPFEKKTFFYINLYVGKKERFVSSRKKISDYSSLCTLLDGARKRTIEQNSGSFYEQKLVSLLLLGRRLSEKKEKEEKAKAYLSINWDLPTITVEIKEVFSKTFVASALSLLFSIYRKGANYNLIIIAHEKDEYSKKTVGFVEKTMGLFELEKKAVRFSFFEKANIINAASLDQETKMGIIGLSSCYFDASKRSIESLIDQEFKKL